MNVCVYCSSKKQLDEKFYIMGEEFGAMLAKNKHTLVYGGNIYGIMGAVAKGAHKEHGDIIGIIPEIFNNDEQISPYLTKIIHTTTMRERKKVLENNSDAFVILPGGVGTFDELFETIVLVSLGESKPKPIYIYNFDGVYDLLEKMLNESVEIGLTSKKDQSLFHFYKNAEDIIESINKYKRW